MNRCAASISQAGSLNAISHSLGGKDIPLVGGNVFGDISASIVGPEPGTDPTIGTNEGIDHGVAGGSEVILGEFVKRSVRRIAISTASYLGTPHTLRAYTTPSPWRRPAPALAVVPLLGVFWNT